MLIRYKAELFKNDLSWNGPANGEARFPSDYVQEKAYLQGEMLK